ncbi:MAG: baseplate J/gp47 family protein [Spirochaetaceae bacterium]|nr:baseplate J/gp47 family protein [Spirochaetaceae bacterium]
MSFKIDGVTWEPKTAVEHADLIIDKINQLLQENNVTDKDGNIIQLNKNYGNALYLLALGDGERFADNDAALSQAIDSFNIELADEQQIENLLPIAAITRNPGSYSTLKLTVTASEDGACTIPAGTKAPFENMNFVTQAEAIIPAGHTQTLDTVADVIGPVVVLTGEVTAFDTEIANLESVENLVSSVPGNAAETTDSLRRRILKGQTIPYSLDGVKIALEELTGVNHARVYFNYNVDGNLTLPGNIEIYPRTAYIVINGQSDELAKTYAKYMSAPTQNIGDPTGTKTTVNLTLTAGPEGASVGIGEAMFIYNGVTFTNTEAATIAASGSATIEFEAEEVGPVIIPAGEIELYYLDPPIEGVTAVTNAASVPGTAKTAWEQNYTTESGQLIPIKYDTAAETIIYVKILIQEGAETGDQITNQLKKDLIKSSAAWMIGESITSLVTSVPFDGCTYTTVAYTQVSTDGVNWGNMIEVPANSIPRVIDETIEIQELSS